MPNREIEIAVAPDGGITVEAIGFTGTACEKATAELERQLGHVVSTKKKPEYYAATTAKNTQRVRG